jgi:hypothetical protein
LFVPESRDASTGRSLDLLGLATSAGSLFALTFGLVEANHYGWSSTPILACFAAAAAGLASATVPDDKAGVASGVVTTFRQTGGVPGVAIMGAILAAHVGGLAPGDARLPAAFMSGFRAALLTGGVVAIVGGLVGALSVSSSR